LTPFWNLIALLTGLSIGWLARLFVERRDTSELLQRSHDLSIELFEQNQTAEEIRTQLGVRTRELQKSKRESELLKHDRDVLEREVAQLSRGRSLRSESFGQGDRGDKVAKGFIVGKVSSEDHSLVPGLGVESEDLAGSWARHHHLDVLAPFEGDGQPPAPSESGPMEALAVHQTGPRVRVRPSAAGPPGRRPSAYPLTRLDEIEPRHVHRLQELGISTTYDLLMKAVESDGQRRLARELAHPGVTEEVIGRWARLCDLMRIPGVSSPFAERLLDSGVGSVGELAKETSANLFVRMTERWMGELPGDPGEELPEPQQLEDWIHSAAILESGL
jgi:hypothetical protein